MNTRLTLIGTPGNWWQGSPFGGDVTPSELLSATINSAGDEITLVFDESITGQTGFTLSSDGGALTMTGSSGDGTETHVFTLSRTVEIDETITLDYDSGVGTCVDDASNFLEDITDFPVTNGSTVPDSGGGGGSGSAANLLLMGVG